MELEAYILRAQSRCLAAEGLLQSAEYLALLAISQEQHPSAESLTLLGSVLQWAGESRRALHFLQQAQQVAELEHRSRPRLAAALPAAPAEISSQLAVQPVGADMPALLVSIADCHERLGELGEAVAALERIPAEHRCAGTWARLGRLHSQSSGGARLAAIAAYKACLRACPHAVEAALALADLRVPAEEIRGLLAGIKEPGVLADVVQDTPELRSCVLAAERAPPVMVGVSSAQAALAATSNEADEPAAMAVDGGAPRQQTGEALTSPAVANGCGQPAGARAGQAGTLPQQHHEQQQEQRDREQRQDEQPPLALLQQPMCNTGRQEDEALGWADGLLRGSSACKRELRQGAAAAEEGGPVETPTGSPVAVTAQGAFSPGSGQATPATTSPAVQPPAHYDVLDAAQADGLGSNGQQQQRQVRQGPPVRRMLHLRSPSEAADVAVRPSSGTGGAPAVPPTQQSYPQQLVEQHHEAEEEQQALSQLMHAQQQQPQHVAERGLPAALLSAAHCIHAFVCQLVELAAALAAEDKERALPLAQQLLATAPGHPLALVLAARCQADHGAVAAALSLYARAREADPYGLAGTARHADLLRQAGDTLALAQLASRVCADAGQQCASGRADPWLVAAHAKELAGDLYEAVGLVRKAQEREPGSAEAHLQMARLLHKVHAAAGAAAGACATGLADFAAALRLRPSVRCYREAVAAALDANMPAEARRLAREARRTFPASQACAMLQARVLARQPDTVVHAELLLAKALEQDPSCEEAVVLLSTLLAQRGLHTEACNLLAAHMRDGSEVLHVTAGRLALDRRELEAAVSHFHAALGHNPHSAAAAEGLQEVEGILAPPRNAGSDSDLDAAADSPEFADEDSDIPLYGDGL